jgi:hypothetical protein
MHHMQKQYVLKILCEFLTKLELKLSNKITSQKMLFLLFIQFIFFRSVLTGQTFSSNYKIQNWFS